MIDVKKYALAIIIAQQAANDAHLGIDIQNDGGSCNFDGVMIDFTGVRQTTIQKIADLAGIAISEKWSGWWKGCCYIGFNLNGQAENRSRMARAAYESLISDEVPAMMYEQAD